MARLKDMDFVTCHSCKHINDVSRHSYVFEKNPEKQTIQINCEKCSSSMTLVISMVYGLTSIENIVKRKQSA